MSALYLYFVRHGQTQFNVQGLVQGHNDSSLTELGISQAIALGKGCRGIAFTRAYSGPCGRQYQTAEYVLQYSENTNVTVGKLDCFKEMGYGDFQGGPVKAMMEAASRILNTEVESYHDPKGNIIPYEISFAIQQANPSVERIVDIQKRLMEGIKQVINENPEGGNVLIASSACAIDLICQYLFPDQKHLLLPDNCSITKIKLEDHRFTLLAFSDISYRCKGEE